MATGVAQMKERLTENYSADLPIERFDTIGIPFYKGAEVKTDLTPFIENESQKVKDICQYDRKMELLAACYGISQERLTTLIKLFDPKRTGVILGIGADITQFELFETEIMNHLSHDNNAMVELFTSINDNGNKMNPVINGYDVYSLYLAQKFNAAAFQKSICTACVSSTQAIAMGYEAIQNNEAEVVISGGTDSLICVLGSIAFGKLGVIPESSDQADCKPFDVNRNGTLAGESAGFVVLANEDFVTRNNIKPIAELVGYGNSLDAFKITAPDPEGNAIIEAMTNALERASLKPNDIDYINAHGTATKHNDQLELKCIKRVFGDAANEIPISSTKSRHGHAIAAAGVQEICVLLECMKHSFVPGNLNLNVPCEKEVNLPTENATKEINYALSNNFAFGGINTALILKNEMS